MSQDLQGIGATYPLVITGPEDMFEATRDLAGPVTRFFERMPLGPFSLEDTREAVRGPLRAAGHFLTVDDDAVEIIWKRTGGHPYFVAFVMREAVDKAVERGATVITTELLAGEWPAIARQLAVEKFSVEWNSATQAERRVLRAVAEGTPVADAAGKSGTSLAVRLVKKGLLSRLSRGEYAPYHPLFAEYVRSAPD